MKEIMWNKWMCVLAVCMLILIPMETMAAPSPSTQYEEPKPQPENNDNGPVAAPQDNNTNDTQTIVDTPAPLAEIVLFDDPVPLADMPESETQITEDLETATIIDEGVPLASSLDETMSPRTGDDVMNTILAIGFACVAIISGCAIKLRKITK